MVYDAVPHTVRVISNSKLVSKHISRTFHGRDIFAPAAAHLERKVPAAQFGKPVKDYVRSEASKPAQFSRHGWRGVVLKTDRFGNLITNLHIDQFPDVKTRPFELRAGLEKIRRLALTYAETTIGEVFAIVGSAGYIEVAANQGSAAAALGCGAGAEVELEIFYN
jgi:S-adenosylmethionine hydrolase